MTRSPTLCGGISVQVQFSTIRLFWKMTVLWSMRAQDPRDWVPSPLLPEPALLFAGLGSHIWFRPVLNTQRLP